MTIVRKNEIYNRENLVRPFLVHQVLGPKPPPPPPCSKEALPQTYANGEEQYFQPAYVFRCSLGAFAGSFVRFVCVPQCPPLCFRSWCAPSGRTHVTRVGGQNCTSPAPPTPTPNSVAKTPWTEASHPRRHPPPLPLPQSPLGWSNRSRNGTSGSRRVTPKDQARERLTVMCHASTFDVDKKRPSKEHTGERKIRQDRISRAKFQR